LLDREGHIVKQAAGDETSSAGFLLTGKPPRGRQRILECLTHQKNGRKKKVEQRLGELLAKERPDFVWFHNIAGGEKWGWSEEMILIARQYAPVLWTLHDMWALGNGDESYWEVNSSVECRRVQGARLQTVCGAAEKYPALLTAPSRWLAELIPKVTGQRCSFLPNPIDLKIFCPGDRVAARRRLGLPDEGMIILAGADSLQDRRKGFDLLREAWPLAGKHGATLALFGRHAENRPGERYLGNLSSDDEMVAAFRAADLYVHPARMENAPCTIQESMACGTPALAFAVGGIPEMIVPGRTGFLADKVSPESLHGALTSVLSDPSRLRGMREESRKTAEVVWRPQSLLEQFEEVAGAVVSGW
jgi:glycosyltransferase involved in cell wall biosynthesis